MEKKTRRLFFHYSIASLIFVLVFVWNKLTLKHLDLIRKESKIFPFAKNKLVTFYQKYIVVNKKQTTVFSAHCTHLGCTINKFENNRLICPCHGSEFDLEGQPVKGPAFKSLEKVSAQITDDKKQIEIIG